MTCTFDGYGDYAPSTSGNVGVAISAFNQVGSIKLYTNPTTYNPYKSCVLYIVFQAAPGGPAPTGGVSITIGRNYTPIAFLASNGTLSVRLNPLPLPGGADQITIHYYGDSYYRWTSSSFSLTNPAIPSNAPTSGGSGNSSGGSGGKAGSPQATTTATAPGTTSVATLSPAGAQNASAGSSSSDSSGGSPLLWIGLGVLVLGLGGGGLALVVRARLAKSRLSVPLQAPHNTGWPQSLDEPPF